MAVTVTRQNNPMAANLVQDTDADNVAKITQQALVGIYTLRKLLTQMFIRFISRCLTERVLLLALLPQT